MASGALFCFHSPQSVHARLVFSVSTTERVAILRQLVREHFLVCFKKLFQVFCYRLSG